jgi:hypothetical protein
MHERLAACGQNMLEPPSPCQTLVVSSLLFGDLLVRETTNQDQCEDYINKD